MKKKILAVMLSAVLTVTMLAGCGDSVETGGTAETKGTEAGGNRSGYEGAVEFPLSASFILSWNDAQVETGKIEYNDAGNIAKCMLYDFDGNIGAGLEYEYDVFGNVIKFKQYEGADASSEIEVEYEYDASGNVTKFWIYYADGTAFEGQDYEYYDILESLKNRAEYMMGFMTGGESRNDPYRSFNDGSISFHSLGSWEESEYDDYGNEIKHTEYDYADRIISWYEREYDVFGNVTKHTEYNSEGNITSWYEREIDDYGKVTKYTEYDSYGSIVNGYGCKYDDYGNVIKYTRYGSYGSIEQWYECEYDTFGNMTKYTQYNPDGIVNVRLENGYDAAGNMEKSIYECDNTIQASFEREYDPDSHELKFLFHYYGTDVTWLWAYDMETHGVICEFETLVQSVRLKPRF